MANITLARSKERKTYVNFLQKKQSGTRSTNNLREEFKIAPLFSWSSSDAALQKENWEFAQYALLGNLVASQAKESAESSLVPSLSNLDLSQMTDASSSDNNLSSKSIED